MRNLRLYYSAEIQAFLQSSDEAILGKIVSNESQAELRLQQNNTWRAEIAILKRQLAEFREGRIIFEYIIPRMGKRVDTVILYKNIVFLLEFKCGDREYSASAYDQVYDYALDLRNFQKESHNVLLVPIVVATKAESIQNEICEKDRIVEPLRCNETNIAQVLVQVAEKFCDEAEFDYIQWENSEYMPTPTIIEAAQALYRGNDVKEITRSDAGAYNLTTTTKAVNEIIEYSKANGKKSICFVTGVPGAGKTLVGLNIAIERSNAQKGEHAVFLSGNFPLVTVLQEALARDKVQRDKLLGRNARKTDALRQTSAFIQIIHKYRDSFVGNDSIPPERVAIFDEAQRAWTHEQIANFMKTKKGVEDFPYSEPEFLIQTMNRHKDWAVIVCLVGGGQEINTGEAGLPEWFDSLRRSFPDWEVFVSPNLDDTEYRRDKTWSEMIADLSVHKDEGLHLATSIRSFRTPDLAAFVKALLDVDVDAAKAYYRNIKDKYPILLTRNLVEAKKWVKEQCQGTTRYGLIASSGGLRLKPFGIFVKNDVSIANWFLNGKDDVRSSYYLEDVVSEFDIQGLELDYTIVAWDADFRFDGQEWTYFNFSGDKWKNVNNDEKRLYLKNAYRVLLTRARQGMAIFVPEGSDDDKTRRREFYDKIYELLKTVMSE